MVIPRTSLMVSGSSPAVQSYPSSSNVFYVCRRRGERGTSSGCEESLSSRGPAASPPPDVGFPSGWQQSWARRKTARDRRTSCTKSPARHPRHKGSLTPSPTPLDCPKSPAPLDCLKSLASRSRRSLPPASSDSGEQCSGATVWPKERVTPRVVSLWPREVVARACSCGGEQLESSAAVWTVTRMRNLGADKCTLEIMRIFQQPPCEFQNLPVAGAIVLDSPWTVA